MNFDRRISRAVRVGDLTIGGGAKISIQSMTNTDTHDVIKTYDQIMRLREAGCDIVRLTAPDTESVKTFEKLKGMGVDIPLVADIHFDYKIAVMAAKSGADKIRINPGNIGSRERVEAVVNACRECRVPIRIGVNSGSLEKSILEKHGAPTGAALAESALYHASLLEGFDFYDTVISVKASNVAAMLEANRILAEKTDYPLHLGVTEAGGGERALIKSSIGIGTLLAEGIGDTVRVSLTDDPVEEIYAAKDILSCLSLTDDGGMDIVSCPTCGRTKIDLIRLLREFKTGARERGLDKMNIKVALMGCAVNGPGEAREADIGACGGDGEGFIMANGKILRRVPEDRLVYELLCEIEKMKR